MSKGRNPEERDDALGPDGNRRRHEQLLAIERKLQSVSRTTESSRLVRSSSGFEPFGDLAGHPDAIARLNNCVSEFRQTIENKAVKNAKDSKVRTVDEEHVKEANNSLLAKSDKVKMTHKISRVLFPGFFGGSIAKASSLNWGSPIEPWDVGVVLILTLLGVLFFVLYLYSD